MNVSEELARLAQLRNDGVLTEEEFQAQKAAVLAGGSAATPAAAPVKPAPSKGKAALGCLALIVVIVVILIAIGASGDGGTANEQTAAASATPPTEVSAADLARAYEANEAAAQQQYGSGPLLVSGTIDAIDLDFADKPVVRLKTANQFMGANANLTEASQAKAGTLSKGTAIKLLCGGVGEVMGSPQLKDCEIQ